MMRRRNAPFSHPQQREWVTEPLLRKPNPEQMILSIGQPDPLSLWTQKVYDYLSALIDRIVTMVVPSSLRPPPPMRRCPCGVACGECRLLGELRGQLRLPFDGADEGHFEVLIRVADAWGARPSDTHTGRAQRNWGSIGFQGKDPSTDIRAMGMFGAELLLAVGQRDPELVERALARGDQGYPLAIACFAAANMVLDLFGESTVTTTKQQPASHHKHLLCSWLHGDSEALVAAVVIALSVLDELWSRELNPTVMSFPGVLAATKVALDAQMSKLGKNLEHATPKDLQDACARAGLLALW
jgi:hypothetical protein